MPFMIPPDHRGWDGDELVEVRLSEPTPGFGHKLPCVTCEARGWIEGIG